LSLTGNLEDLPLLDIIQIVSFSKKTGYLTIRASSGLGAIVFHDGFVVASFTWDTAPIDPRTLPPPGERRQLLEARMGIALEQLVRLREGQFDFSLTTEVPQIVGGRDITPETLDLGINPQELLLNLARGIDEDRRDSSAAIEASFAQPSDEALAATPVPPVAEEAAGDEWEAPAESESEAPPAFPEEEPPEPVAGPPTMGPAPAPAPGEITASGPPAVPEAAPPVAPARTSIRTILLVDDEEDVRQALGESFKTGGYEVFGADGPAAAAKAAQRLRQRGGAFLLVTDLGMPTTGGASFQGGFEVVKRLWKMNLRPPVLMMTDRLSSALGARARQMGVSRFVFKPSLSKLDPEQYRADLQAFAGKLLSDVFPGLGSAPAPQPATEPQKRRVPAAAAIDVRESADELRQLQKLLEELRRPGDASRISQLVMRMAREFFERAILFLVKDDEMRGLGGFGSAPRGESLHLLVREVAIPLAEPSVFHDVAHGRKRWSGPLPAGRWSQHLLGRIGAFRSTQVALFPLVSHRETMALLFGDNPETGRELGRMDVLDVFINQAGVALENAFLQRKLAALEQRS